MTEEQNSCNKCIRFIKAKLDSLARSLQSQLWQSENRTQDQDISRDLTGLAGGQWSHNCGHMTAILGLQPSVPNEAKEAC